jgi:hypothetical protein
MGEIVFKHYVPGFGKWFPGGCTHITIQYMYATGSVLTRETFINLKALNKSELKDILLT